MEQEASAHFRPKVEKFRCIRSIGFHNHGEGPYVGLLLVEIAYKSFYILDTIKNPTCPSLVTFASAS